MIVVFGDLVWDILIAADGALQPGSDVPGRISQRGGGSAANTACWLGALNCPCTFMGRVGRDTAGRLLAAEFEPWPISVHLAEGPEATGVIAVLVDEQGQKTMITQRGANLGFCWDELQSLIPSQWSWLHWTGYSLFQSPGLRGAALQLHQLAGKQKRKISLDPSSYALLRAYGPEAFCRETQGCYVFLPNADEAALLTGAADPQAAGRALLELYPRVVISLGSDGCLSLEQGHIQYLPSLTQSVIDTTGAGDAFNAGVIWGLTRGLTLPEAARAGQILAADCIGRLGARPLKRLDEALLR